MRLALALMLTVPLLACSKPQGTTSTADAGPESAGSVVPPRLVVLDVECASKRPAARLACDDLGEAYAKASPPDLAKAATYFGKACDQGLELGCRHLAELYTHGRGVKQDRARAIELYGKACTQGLALACMDLGDLYAKGLGGGPAEPAKAVPYYGRACIELAFPLACRDLARHYRDGVGVAKDPAKALGFYEKGCTDGDRLTCDDLGDVHARGIGVPVDKKKAATYYQKACDAGLEMGCTHLAALNRIGRSPAPLDGVQ